MNTVTLQKQEYQTLKKRASLYEKIFRVFPEKIFGLESYTDKQAKEFLKEDRLDKKTLVRLEKLLKHIR